MLIIYYKIHRDIKLSRLKTVAEKYKGDVEAYGTVLDQKKNDLDHRFNDISNQTLEMINKVESQLAEIKAYNDDLIKLQNAMVTYNEALNRLSQMTKKLEDKIEMVKVKAEALEAVENKINKQSEKLGELENLTKAVKQHMEENTATTLQDQKIQSEELAKENLETLQHDLKTVEVSAKTHILNLEKQIKLTEVATHALTDKAGPMLVECADRYAMLANEQKEIKRMNDEKEDLTKQLDDLRKEKELLTSLIQKNMNPDEPNPEVIAEVEAEENEFKEANTPTEDEQNSEVTEEKTDSDNKDDVTLNEEEDIPLY